LLFSFFIFSLFPITSVVSANDYYVSSNSKFYGISSEDYDPSDYLEETPLPEQLDQESTNVIIGNEQNNMLLLQPTLGKYKKSAEVTTTTTINYLSENDSDDINFIAAGDWSCNKETKKTIKNYQVRP
jgi:hypothetical protein